MSGHGDALLEGAILQRARRTAADVLDLLPGARTAVGESFLAHEYALHVVLHRLVRAGALAVVGTSPRGLALYGPPGAAVAGQAYTPGRSSEGDVAHFVANAVRDPAARARVHHDLLAHHDALVAEHGERHARVFGRPRAARALLKRVDRGHRAVVLLTGAGDTLLRLLVHEGPWLLGSVLLFLVIKFLVADVFVIPSDSMVPTLIQQDRVVVGHRWPGWMPDRWQVVTFRHRGVDGPNTTWVKRVVGLPGEELSIWRGDLWVNGVRLVKPQDMSAALRSRIKAWTFGPPDPRAGWSVQGREAGVDDWLPPPDALPGSTHAGESPVDLYLELDAEVPERGLATLHLDRSGGRGTALQRSHWQLDVGRDGIRLSETLADGGAPSELWRESAPLSGRLTLRLAVVDGVVHASVGERVWSGARGMPSDRALFQFSLADGAKPLAFRLDQDLHYSNRGSLAVSGDGKPPSQDPGEHRHKVPDGHVFFLGDNTQVSNDSRFPDVGDIPVKRLVGPVIFRIWPPRRIGSVR